jgi:hypothetical protein
MVEMDLDLVDNLLKKLARADWLSKEQELWDNCFMGLQFDSYDPVFVELDLEDLGLDEEDEGYGGLEDGYLVLPARLENYEWVERSMCHCVQVVMAANGSKSGGRIYWYAYDKHGDASSRAETYSLHETDLREIAELLERSTLNTGEE